VNKLVALAGSGALDPFANSSVTAARKKVPKTVKNRGVCK
jgi:hypothetical protein